MDLDCEREREIEGESRGPVDSYVVESETSELEFRIGGVKEEDCGGEEEDGGGVGETLGKIAAKTSSADTVVDRKNDDVLVGIWGKRGIGLRIPLWHLVACGG